MLFLTSSWGEVCRDLVAREGSLQEHSLAEVGWEIDEHPSIVFDFFDLFHLCLAILNLLGDYFLCPTLLWFHTTFGIAKDSQLLLEIVELLFELEFLLCLVHEGAFELSSALARLIHPELGYEQVNVEIVGDLLAFIEAVVDQLTASSEVLLRVELFLDLAGFRLDVVISLIGDLARLPEHWVLSEHL